MSTPTKSPAKSALRKASLFYFVWVMFSYCTGGPFGLEDMVTTSGPGMTLIYLLVIPFFWCIPVSLVSAELTTAMPVEGGFYRWVRAGFGDFWGFLAGWWNWCASFLLGSCLCGAVRRLPALLLSPTHRMAPLARLSAMCRGDHLDQRARHSDGGEIRHRARAVHPAAGAGPGGDRTWPSGITIRLSRWCLPTSPSFSVFGVGLALGLWLYSGYEQCSTVAEEVDNPRRTYPIAPRVGRPHVDRGLFLAHAGVAGGAGQLERLAHRILLHRSATHRRPMARRLDDGRRHDHKRLPAQRHNPGLDAHALRHGRRRLPAARPQRQASALWNPVDRNHRFVR